MEQYQGNFKSLTNKKKSSSENAFNIRKKCEGLAKTHCQLDTDVAKLNEKKRYLENLVAAEKRKFGNIKEKNTEAHIKMRNMQVNLWLSNGLDGLDQEGCQFDTG